MKLIELLARELKEWPEGAEWAQQSKVDCEIYFRPADTCDFYASARADDYIDAKVTREQWENATNQPHDPIPGSTDTPTLETMLTEWRDLEARAQAAQAEADALFEHAGQCHGGIVVRLAELGWGAPRGPMVPGEPVVTLDMTDWRNLRPGDIIECVGDDWLQSWGGKEAVVKHVEEHDYRGCLTILASVGGMTDWGGGFRFISRPSTQP